MEETRMPLAQRFWKVLAAPGEAFQAIAQDPRFLWPVLIIIAITLLLTMLTIPETREYSMEVMAASGMTPEQIAMAMQFVVPSALIGVVVALPFMWLIQTVLLVIYNQFSVGEAGFKQLFAVAVFAGLPSIIKSVISTGLIKTIGLKAAMEFNSSLAVFMGTADQGGFLYNFLGHMELFSIWGLVLLVVGSSIAMKKKAGGLAVYIGVIWLVYAATMALLVKTPIV